MVPRIQPGVARSRASYIRQTEVLQHAAYFLYRAQGLECERLSFLLQGGGIYTEKKANIPLNIFYNSAVMLHSVGPGPSDF